jgi:hypothetical protein
MNKFLIMAVMIAVTGLPAICQDSKSVKVSMKLLSGDFCTNEMSGVTVRITNRGSDPVLIDVASIGRSGGYRENGKWVEFDSLPKYRSEFVRIGSGEKRNVEAKFDLMFSTFTGGTMRLSLEAVVIPENADPGSEELQTLISTKKTTVRFRLCNPQT